MDKKAFLAIALSLAVWILWFYFVNPPQKQKRIVVPAVEKTDPNGTSVQSKAVTPAEKDATATPSIKSQIGSVRGAAAKADDIEIKTDKYRIILTSEGAAIKRFIYKEKNVDLVVDRSKFFSRGRFDFSIAFAEDQFLSENALDSLIWSHARNGNRVVFSATMMINDVPVELQKIYSFDKGYSFKLESRIVNKGNKDAVFPNNYIIISPSDFLGPDLDFESTYNQPSGMYFQNGAFEKPTKGGGFFSEAAAVKKVPGVTQWIGIMSRYFVFIMIPEGFTGTGVIYDNRTTHAHKTGMILPVNSIKPGKDISRSYRIYVGEKNKDHLLAVDKTIVDAADVSSWIEPIRDFLMWCLLKINMVLGNMGWSLIVFSVVTKILFIPLTKKSTDSMKKLQNLNPMITEIREKYKDKPEKMNQEIMKLYKQEKVNPLGGCLPMLLQMPFFFALYSALTNSMDLWHAPFIFWIKDLSMPDTVYQISGFNINILPVLMTVSTYLQQKFSGGDAVGAAAQQQKMMKYLPLIFIVIFWNMPSGLVLYWTMQNVLQVAHQVYVMKWGKNDTKK